MYTMQTKYSVKFKLTRFFFSYTIYENKLHYIYPQLLVTTMYL